jgi:hypothetical protein
VRAGLAGTLDTLLAPFVDIGAKAHKMDGNLVVLALPDVRDGVGLLVDLEGGGADETAIPQFLEELKKPSLASECGAEV